MNKSLIWDGHRYYSNVANQLRRMNMRTGEIEPISDEKWHERKASMQKFIAQHRWLAVKRRELGVWATATAFTYISLYGDSPLEPPDYVGFQTQEEAQKYCQENNA